MLKPRLAFDSDLKIRRLHGNANEPGGLTIATGDWQCQSLAGEDFNRQPHASAMIPNPQTPAPKCGTLPTPPAGRNPPQTLPASAARKRTSDPPAPGPENRTRVAAWTDRCHAGPKIPETRG
jgi:hypothetical protein